MSTNYLTVIGGSLRGRHGMWLALRQGRSNRLKKWFTDAEARDLCELIGSTIMADWTIEPSDPLPPPTDWYVTNEFFDRGGQIILGPFSTDVGAYGARRYVEKIEGHANYFIDSRRGAESSTPQKEA